METQLLVHCLKASRILNICCVLAVFFTKLDTSMYCTFRVKKNPHPNYIRVYNIQLFLAQPHLSLHHFADKKIGAVPSVACTQQQSPQLSPAA